LGGVDRGVVVERGEMGHELDSGVALSARERVEACEKVLILGSEGARTGEGASRQRS
jgi:hypothetical protein